MYAWREASYGDVGSLAHALVSGVRRSRGTPKPEFRAPIGMVRSGDAAAMRDNRRSFHHADVSHFPMICLGLPYLGRGAGYVPAQFMMTGHSSEKGPNFAARYPEVNL